MTLKILDLFSGIGGFSLGLEATGHFETKAFCEIEPYCQQVLKKNFPGVPIFDDIRTLKGTDIGAIDIITGGYPCQPFSVAGKQKAEQDPRHLWPEYFRLIQELKPTWVIGENVSGHIKLGLDSVLEDLASEGYSTRTFSISASSIGANHKRERVWTVAYSGSIANAKRGINNSLSKESRSWSYYEGRGRANANGISHPSTNERLDSEDVANSQSQWRREPRYSYQEKRSSESSSTQPQSSSSDVAYTYNTRNRTSQHETNSDREKINEGWQEQSFSELSRQSKNVADSDSERLKEQWRPKSISTKGDKSECSSSEEGIGWWESEPRVGRVAHGIPKRVDRLKSLGNAVVPHIPYYIGQAIIESYQ